MRYFRAVGATIACLLAAYLTMLGTRAARSGLSWREMDFDRDGTTSIGELLDATDVDTRTVRREGRLCTEYYRLKDGLPVKLSCPAARR